MRWLWQGKLSLVLMTLALVNTWVFASGEKPLSKIYAEILQPIDAIVCGAIDEQAFPGCQLVIQRKGQTIFDRSYGHLTYDSLLEVTPNTLYDVASVTKVAATTLMVMDLFEKGFLELDEPIVCYLPELRGTDKERITLRQLLSHNAGLKSYLPFWEKALEYPYLFKPALHGFGFVPGQSFLDSMRYWIGSSKLLKYKKTPPYKYSDVGFLLVQQILEEVSGESIEQYVAKNFYQPMGLKSMCFNPLVKGFSLSGIAPTGFDKDFRNRQIWGSVHDENAAILGGVAGHAGLFSTANDMAKLMSMVLQNGTYEGQRYFKPSTVQAFTRQYFRDNRRALGWDTPHDKVSDKVGKHSFGHTGFTGTLVWVDPEHDLVFVMLSNRVYPDPENKKLMTLQVRSRIQDVVYDAIAQEAELIARHSE
jgi:beta-N-acetylhexosaminidase